MHICLTTPFRKITKISTHKGGHSHRYCVHSCDWGQNAVKALLRGRSNGQAAKKEQLYHVMWSASIDHAARLATAHAHLRTVNGSRTKIRDGQAVKANFWRSNILTPVAATPLCTQMHRMAKPLNFVPVNKHNLKVCSNVNKIHGHFYSESSCH